MRASASDNSPQNTLASQYLVWLDGVGVFLICMNDAVTFGGVRPDDNRADVCFPNDLPRKLFSIQRRDGRYGRNDFNEDEIDSLEPKTQWNVQADFEISFDVPSVLSSTAVLEFPTGWAPQAGTPPTTVDRVILMDQNCLIGPGGGQHISLPSANTSFILFRIKQELWCKSPELITRNAEHPQKSWQVRSGDVFSSDDVRFRMEALGRQSSSVCL